MLALVDRYHLAVQPASVGDGGHRKEVGMLGARESLGAPRRPAGVVGRPLEERPTVHAYGIPHAARQSALCKRPLRECGGRLGAPLGRGRLHERQERATLEPVRCGRREMRKLEQRRVKVDQLDGRNHALRPEAWGLYQERHSRIVAHQRVLAPTAVEARLEAVVAEEDDDALVAPAAQPGEDTPHLHVDERHASGVCVRERPTTLGRRVEAMSLDVKVEELAVAVVQVLSREHRQPARRAAHPRQRHRVLADALEEGRRRVERQVRPNEADGEEPRLGLRVQHAQRADGRRGDRVVRVASARRRGPLHARAALHGRQQLVGRDGRALFAQVAEALLPTQVVRLVVLVVPARVGKTSSE
eukprot:66669-Prymnesium_polylepis.1